METSMLTVKECVSFGWRTFKARPWFFVGTVVVYVIVQFIVGAIQEMVPGFVSFLISIIASVLLYTGLLAVYLKAHDNVSTPKLGEMWNPAPFFKYLALSVLLLLIVGVGLILLIVPGIILGLAFSFAGFLVIDRNMGPIEALKESARLTKGHRWKLFLLALALMGLMILGMIPLMLGLLVVLPLGLLASIHAYRTLSGGALTKVENSAPAAPEVA